MTVAATHPPLTLPVAWLDGLPDSCVVFNQDRRVVYCNPPFAARYGHTTDELLGKELRSWLPEFFDSALHRLCEQVHETNRPQQADETVGCSHIHLHGHPVPGGVMALLTEIAVNGCSSREKTSATRVDRQTPLPGSLRALTTRPILIVDDEPFLCDVAARVLRKAGYQTRCVNSGREALDLIRRDPLAVQLVLLDLLMPDLDGWATLAALRQIRGDLVVVLTGGQPEEEIRAQRAEAQTVKYVAKPYALDALVLAVEQALCRG